MTHRTGLTAGVIRAIEITEDTVHVLVAALLAVVALILTADTVHEIAAVLTGHTAPVVLLAVLDETLLLFIVAELLHTVAIALRYRRALDPEPFLVVGLVAGIRRMLVLTGEAEQSFHWNPEGIELLIVMALVLVMAVTVLVWRRSLAGRPNRDPPASS